MREHREIVRERVAKESLVISLRKLIGEAQHVIGLAVCLLAISRLSVDVRVLIANVFSTLGPFEVERFPADAYPHALGVKRMILGEVHNVELHLFLCET